MSITEIEHRLSTPEGFSRAVASQRKLKGAALACLLLGAFGIGTNLFQLGVASDWNWPLMFAHFFDAQAIHFTGSRASRGEFWRYLAVYAPIILVPLGIILLFVHLATRKSFGTGLFADFQSRGWVGRQRLTGLSVPQGRTEINIVLVSSPEVADETFEAVASRYAASVSLLDKKARKAAVRAATGAGVMKGTSASALSPEIPAALVASPAQGKGEFVAVIPPAPGTVGPVRVLRIK